MWRITWSSGQPGPAMPLMISPRSCSLAAPGLAPDASPEQHRSADNFSTAPGPPFRDIHQTGRNHLQAVKKPRRLRLAPGRAAHQRAVIDLPGPAHRLIGNLVTRDMRDSHVTARGQVIGK